MKTITFPFQADHRKIIRQLLLNENGCIIYPTETFYALGCAANNSEAIGKIYSLKKRNRNQPLLVLINSWEMFDRYTLEVGESELKLLKKHWPGPLTAIIKQKGNLASELNQGGSTLGFRMTSSPIAQELIQIAGLPLVGTSANQTGKAEMVDCDSVKKNFAETVDIYIDGGKTPGILPSTLVDLTTGDWTVVRQGMISI